MINNIKPRVLFIDERFAVERNSGKMIRTGNLLESCSQDFAITYLAYAATKNETEAAVRAWKPYGVEIVPVIPPAVNKSGVGQAWTAARVLMRKDPASVAAWRSKQFHHAVQQQLSNHQFDLIHCEITQMSWAVPFESGLPTVLGAHNIETIIWERLADIERGLKRWIFRDQARKMERFEQDILKRFDQVTCVSQVDNQRLVERFDVSSGTVVPNGVDLGISVQPPPTSDQPVLLYPSALDWRPAQDGAVFLLREILPRLRTKHANIQVQIVGKSPPSWLRALCSKTEGATCHADVPSMAPFFSGAHLVLVPLRVGSGSRLKILESFAYGRPVVSTTIGAEGLDTENARHLCIADSPDEFADGIDQLLNDPSLAAGYVREARQLVEQHHGWSMIGDIMTGVWTRAMTEGNLLS
jgi:glycosyltransferase involved in cell wall biosynthesis